MKPSIPKITNAEIGKRLEHIRPCVRRNGKLHFIDKVDPRQVSFIWDPPLAREAPEMPVLRKIRTLHTYGYYGMFKPSLAEVLAQIPKDIIDQVGAFEVNGPETADDLNQEREALDAGYHVAETTLYGIPAQKATAWDMLGKD